MSIHEVTTSTAARRSRLREILRERELDALLVTDLLNIRYLTGFTGSNAALIVSVSDGPGAEDRTVIATDGRYLVQVGAGARSACRDHPGVRTGTPRTGHGLGRLAGSGSRATWSPSTSTPRGATGAGIDLVRSPGSSSSFGGQGRGRDRTAAPGVCRRRRRPRHARRARRPAPVGRSATVARELEWLIVRGTVPTASRSRRSWPPAQLRVPHHRPPGRCSRPATS